MDEHSLENMVFLMKAIADTNKDFGDEKLSENYQEILQISGRLNAKLALLTNDIEVLRVMGEGDRLEVSA